MAKARTPIADGEWVLTVRLEVGGQQVGDTFELRYADSYLAKNVESTDWLIGRRLEEEAARRKPKKVGKK